MLKWSSLIFYGIQLVLILVWTLIYPLSWTLNLLIIQFISALIVILTFQNCPGCILPISRLSQINRLSDLALGNLTKFLFQIFIIPLQVLILNLQFLKILF